MVVSAQYIEATYFSKLLRSPIGKPTSERYSVSHVFPVESCGWIRARKKKIMPSQCAAKTIMKLNLEIMMVPCLIWYRS